MNVLVTGVGGFVGSHLAKALLKKGYNVVGLTRDHNTRRTLHKLSIDNDVILVYGDIIDKDLLKRILTQYKIEMVFHLAGVTIVSSALKTPAEAFKVNCYGTACLLEACRDVGSVKAMLATSTDKVYGEGLDRIEDSSLDAEGIYENSKVAMERVVKSFICSYKMPIVTTRACNIYGEFDINRRIVPNTVRDLLANKKPLIFKNDDSLREYVYVEDVCDALILLNENIEKTKGNVFNIGTGDVLGQDELVKKIIAVSGKNVEPEYVDKPFLVEIHKQSLNNNKLRKMGWKPRYSLEQGLEKTWNAESSGR